MRKKRYYGKKKESVLSAFWWLLTAIGTIIFSASMISIFNNQGHVSSWIYWVAALDAVFLVVLISTKKFTTNESLAFKRGA